MTNQTPPPIDFYTISRAADGDTYYVQVAAGAYNLTATLTTEWLHRFVRDAFDVLHGDREAAACTVRFDDDCFET